MTLAEAEAVITRLAAERDEYCASLGRVQIINCALADAVIAADKATLDARANLAVQVADSNKRIAPLVDALTKAARAISAAKSGLPLILAPVSAGSVPAGGVDDLLDSRCGPWACGCGASHADIAQIQHAPDCEWTPVHEALAAIQALGIKTA